MEMSATQQLQTGVCDARGTCRNTEQLGGAIHMGYKTGAAHPAVRVVCILAMKNSFLTIKKPIKVHISLMPE